MNPTVGKNRLMLGLAVAVMFLMCASVVVVVYLFDPTRSRIYPPCIFHAVTGLYCPGCGSTRALHQLLHGNVVGALRFNPLIILALPLVIYGLVAEAAKVSGKLLPTPGLSWNVVRLAIIIIIGYGILRNIPVYPLTLLAPSSVSPWR